MKNQVLSIEQMQELIELGIDTSKASMIWYAKDGVRLSTHQDFLEYYKGLFEEIEIIPTFTLQDILEMLPDNIVDKDGYTRIQMILPQDNKEVIIAYDNVKQFSGSWIEAAFNMLKWCKQNNYI